MATDPILAPGATGEVRGTQSFVRTLSWCWKRPGLTGLEIAWRWVLGIPAAWVAWREAVGIWSAAHVDTGALQRMTILNPMASAETIQNAVNLLLPPAMAVATWLVPLLVAASIVISSLGRTVVLRRMGAAMGSPMQSRPVTLMLLQALRLGALAASFGLWVWCLRADAAWAIAGPIAAGREPSLVLFSAAAIVSTLGMFVLWSAVSWVFSVAPLLAMLRGLGAGAALRAGLQLGELRSKLVEINLVMGIVKVALLVLAMVFSATPLPFESVATTTFLTVWWIIVTLLYFIGSDFFHVARAVAYLKLWGAYEQKPGSC